MPNPKPRPSLHKAGVVEPETFTIVDGLGNVVKEFSNMDRIVMLPTVQHLDLIVEKAQAQVDALADRWGALGTGSGYVIDEVALFFRSEGELDSAVRDLVRRDEWLHFNGADDRVKTRPLDTEYTVRYEFFGLQERTYRVEAMALTGGFSPLHWAFENTGRMEVHASFKVPNMRSYEGVCKILNGLGSSYVLGQACESTYGYFSYWRNGPETPLVWLKPRVNVRDGI